MLQKLIKANYDYKEEIYQRNLQAKQQLKIIR